jgi:hypothetical protein
VFMYRHCSEDTHEKTAELYHLHKEECSGVEELPERVQVG